MERFSQLNPHAAPFVPSSSRSFFAESLREMKDPEKQVGDTEHHETADRSAGYELPESLSFYDYSESLGKVAISAESSSKGEAAGSVVYPSQYEGSDAVVKSLLLLFPDVSDDFILEALKAHGFDRDSTIEMIFNLCEADDQGEYAEASGKPQQHQQQQSRPSFT